MENTELTGQSAVSQRGGSKIILIAGVVVVLLLLGIGGFLVMGKKSVNTEQKQAIATAVTPTPSSMFSSIKDALSKSISLECSFTDDLGRKTTSFIKGGAIRSDYVGKNTQESGSIIMKDQKMYFWNGKQGMMMAFDMSQLAGTGTSSAQSVPPGQQNPEDVMESLEKFKENCKPAVIADALFTPPADVKFTDMSELMKAVQKAPSGVPSGAMTEEQIKELQEKFSQ